LYGARRFEPRENIGFDKLLKRYAVLQTYRNCDGEIIHKAAKGRAFLMHINENLAQAAVFKLARMQINFMTANARLLDISCAAIWQAFTRDGFFYNAFDNLLDKAG